MPTAPRLRISLQLSVTALALQACLDPNANTETESTTAGPGTTTEADPTGTPSDTTTTADPTESPPVTTAEPVCGDGFVDADEQCDLGPANADDGACTSECRNAVCGDGLVNKGAEECDAGPDNADDGDCTTACRLPACGDGVLNGDEVCDDGVNDGSYGSCLADCSAAAPGCGDGQVDPELEDCEDGPACLPTCKYAHSCREWLEAVPDAASGPYTIRRDGIMDPIDVFCALDPATDGGGYTFLKVDVAAGMNPSPATAANAETVCADWGMQLFIPRSPAHLAAAYEVATGDNLEPVGGGTVKSGPDYLQILGIYPVTPGESCVDAPLNGLDCPEWRASDDAVWFVSDVAVGSGEPDELGACEGCSMLYQWNQDGSVKSYKALPAPGGYSFRFLCDTGDKLP
ncbi:hypothetical protein SAMN02745121_07673 [Nannocystis exedens]|uniref:Myxococcus cysteine-rich repeat-containing protein n=1 Tax=Nannocystis exedens TaxID=54 RepID=A0A1I2H2H2_9BACT|nr:fibrinogen-like YCDxxxxGGGW domain-containing protein [Nannocystis exedens]PCC67109.1 hypothetical protein NAEX_00112 [Nannocystis exedens]SFF23892.1 hypothetical protein SAMN02745121_07673 [Nannocystis exedens]